MLTAGFPTSDKAASLAAVRRDLEGAVIRGQNGRIRAGIFYAQSTSLVSSRPDMRVDIHDFRAVQDKQGACFFGNVGTAQSPIFEAAPAANRRIDLLYATQKIDAIDGGATGAIFGIVKGAASPVPTVPPLPGALADAIPVATVELPAGATSMQSAGVIITTVCPWTAMAGGTVMMRSRAEVVAWDAADGTSVQCIGDGFEYERRAGKWWCRETRTVQTALAGASAAASGWVYQAIAAVQFVSQFTATPRLVPTTLTPEAAAQVEQLMTKDAAGFRLRALRLALQPVPPAVEYTAFGPIT